MVDKEMLCCKRNLLPSFWHNCGGVITHVPGGAIMVRAWVWVCGCVVLLTLILVENTPTY